MLPEITKSAFSLVEKLIIPKIQSFCKKVDKEYQTVMIPRPEHFQEYFVRSYKKYNSANLLAMKNSQKGLKEIYFPLSLKIIECEKNKCEEKTCLVDGYPKDILEQFQKILVIDSAGMGKSTISKIMFLSIIDTDLSRIPIYIELRRLNKKNTIIDEICEQLNAINKEIDRELLLDFIASGDFIFFFDGFDEIALEDKSYVVKDIQSFIAKAYNNFYVLTSRPEDTLSSFGDFQSCSIAPLSKKDAYSLLRKYDSQGETSRLLIEKIKLPENAAINDFLTNPLLVSMLFSAFEYKQTIPLKKHLFYRQVFDALFDSHDLSKGEGYTHEKRSNLSIDDFSKVLRNMGFNCIKKQSVELDKDSMLQLISTAKDACVGLSFAPSDFLIDLVSAVPLFKKDGHLYSWAHKSLLEYFAAEYVYVDAKQNQDKILNAIYNSGNIQKYSNLLDIYYDIDISGFRKNILLPYFNDYKKLFLCNNNEVNILNSKLFGQKYIIQVRSEIPGEDDLKSFFSTARSKYPSSTEVSVYISSPAIVVVKLEATPLSTRLKEITHLLYKKKYPDINYASVLRGNSAPSLEIDKEYNVSPESLGDYDISLFEDFEKYCNHRLSIWFRKDVVEMNIEKIISETCDSLEDSLLSGI